MKIVIVNGKSEADFLIATLKDTHKLKVINSDKNYATYLCDTHKIPVTCGNACKKYILDNAEITGFDVLIALGPTDADCLAICHLAKENYNISKTVCVVENPRNVELFKSFGVTEVISSAFMAAKQIAQISTLDSLVNSFTLDNSDTTVTELEVSEKSEVIDKEIQHLHLPQGVIIAGIIRGTQMIVPNGKCKIFGGDKVVLISHASLQGRLINLFE